MIFTLTTIVVVALLTALLFWFIQFEIQKSRNIVRYKDGRPLPGPPSIFPFGNALDIQRYGSLGHAIKEWRKKYGNEFQFWFGSRSLVYLHDLVAMKELSSQFHPRFHTWTITEFWSKGILMTNEREHHKVHRTGAVTRLMSTSYLKRIAQIVTQKADSLIEQLALESEVQADVLMSNVTFDIIAMAAFSLDLQSLEGGRKYRNVYMRPLRQFLEGAVEFSKVHNMMKYILYRKFQKVKMWKKEVEDFHKMVLHNRWEDKKRGITKGDFLDYLVSEKDPRTNSNFPEDEILMDIADLFAAGYETISNTLCFALHFLATNLDVQQRLQEESDRFPTEVSYEDAGRLAYAQAVIKETLRMQPIVQGFFRGMECKIEYRNFVMPEESTFYFSIIEFSHDPNYFPNPEKFDPSRWLHTDKYTPGENAWFPFGSGARSCIGKRMAMMQGKIILCKLMQKYSIRRMSDMPLEIEHALTSRPKGGLKLKFIPRV